MNQLITILTMAIVVVVLSLVLHKFIFQNRAETKKDKPEKPVLKTLDFCTVELEDEDNAYTNVECIVAAIEPYDMVRVICNGFTMVVPISLLSLQKAE